MEIPQHENVYPPGYIVVPHMTQVNHGVREYWIVDPETKTVQVCILEDGQYYAPQVYTAGAEVTVSVLEGCVIDLAPVFEEL